MKLAALHCGYEPFAIEADSVIYKTGVTVRAGNVHREKGASHAATRDLLDELRKLRKNCSRLDHWLYRLRNYGITYAWWYTATKAECVFHSAYKQLVGKISYKLQSHRHYFVITHLVGENRSSGAPTSLGGIRSSSAPTSLVDGEVRILTSDNGVSWKQALELLVTSLRCELETLQRAELRACCDLVPQINEYLPPGVQIPTAGALSDALRGWLARLQLHAEAAPGSELADAAAQHFLTAAQPE